MNQPAPDVRLSAFDVLRYLDQMEFERAIRGRLAHALYRDRSNPELVGFLRDHGLRIALHASDITPSQMQAMQRIYRAETLSILTEDPFQAIGTIRGMTYERASQIWRRIGPRHDESSLALAAIREVIRRGREHGDVWMARTSVLLKAQGLSARKPEILSAALDHYITTGGLTEIRDGGQVKLVRTPALETEQSIAARLLMLTGRYPKADRFLVFAAMREAGILDPDPLQLNAAALAMEHQTVLITGGPGTGKSTILKTIRLLHEQSRPGIRLRLVALAARVAREVGIRTGIPSETVHTTLGLGPGGTPIHGPGHPIPADIIFVEEAFMLGNNLFADLLAAVSPATRLVIVGDPEQLPPIMEGRPVEAILQSGKIPTARLETNHRSESPDIPQAGKRIMRGQMLHETANVRQARFQRHADALAHTVRHFELLRDRGESVQILTAMHDGPLGTAALNRAVAGRTQLGIGDAVMQTENDRERGVLNGEIGIIVDQTEAGLVVEREDGTTIPYDKRQYRQLVHAWAITYHKSQGLEYDHVILVTSPTQHRMLSRNLINVGITRAKRSCLIVDHRDGLRAAIATERTNRRTTLLDRILSGHITA